MDGQTDGLPGQQDRIMLSRVVEHLYFNHQGGINAGGGGKGGKGGKGGREVKREEDQRGV